LPGPASTKLLYTIVLTHVGLLPAFLALTFWALPGALGMFGLAQGVSKIGTILPDPVYALLSGLNAATVGLIALAGLQLSTRTITDGLSRTVLIGTACAGMLYTALWYFPVLVVTGALLAIVWDLWMEKWMKGKVVRLRRQFNESRKRRRVAPPPTQPSEEGDEIGMTDHDEKSAEGAQETTTEPDSPPAPTLSVTAKQGVAIIVAFFVIFITLMVLRSTMKDAPVDLRLFINLFLAGTIIFGGGPVVVPLLREYVVAEGWVSSRDFLIGLAAIQAFPGPNFNCEWCSSASWGRTQLTCSCRLPCCTRHSLHRITTSRHGSPGLHWHLRARDYPGHGFPIALVAR
jgi:chromate transport protein ChrA